MLQPGNKLFNFTVTSIRPIPGQEAELVQMVYEKTGTELCWTRNSERNKLFGIAFKTVPEDNTGVFHILEHSVLCGSDKYPVKEPFVELLKSSMNTFLNAMTFPDKTLYPVSSRNEQDFLNLTSVYLDAVFAPKILDNPNIFRQEGWHYERDGENLTYNGVVFNEMKGAMSSVDQITFRSLMNLLFPDNCYQYNSGGAPDAIPDLTYEQFIHSYKKNYHPTNARIYLDGDIPVDKTLSMIDSYLSRYCPGEKQVLEAQLPVSREKTVSYEAVDDGTPKAQLVLGKILGDFRDKTALLARQVLCDVLAGTNDAPLKRAILSTGLCQDVTLLVEDGCLQPFMMLRLHNIDDKDAPALEKAITDCARELVRDGISKDQLTASINHLAFQVRQISEPQALNRCISALSSWLYDGDPMLYLHYADTVDALRVMAETDRFEQLLEEMLLTEDGLCRLHVLPSQSYGAQLREAETARLAREKAAMDQAQLDRIDEIFQSITKWQQTPDPAEALATLPVLGLDQIDPQPVMTPTEEDRAGGAMLLRHKVASNGIVYLNAYFRLTDCTLEQLTQLSALKELLGSLPTAAHSAADLQKEIKTWLGELSFFIDSFVERGQRKACIPVLTVHCSVLQENLPKAEALIHEILTSTDFRQYDRIRETLLQAETEQQQRAMRAGHMLASRAAQAHFSAAAAVSNATSGITYLQLLHSLNKEFDQRIDSFVTVLEDTLARAICRERLTLSLTEDGRSDLSGFVARFSAGSPCPETAAYQTALPKKLGIRIPAQVSYASIAYHLAEADLDADGTTRLLSNIVSLAHLWNEVRVQGGAYGAGMRIGRSGGLFTYSYRDPSPSRSLEVYRNLGSFVRDFAQTGGDITGFIISSVAETEPLLDAAQQGGLADSNWFCGYGLSQAQAERSQLLNATAGELTKWCPALDAIRDNAAVCVVGYADALASCESGQLTIMDI